MRVSDNIFEMTLSGKGSMSMGSKSIGFLAGGVDACALWREWMPYIALPGAHGYYYQFRPAEVLTHDYVMVQRLGLQQNLNAMKTLRYADMKIIYDLDDFLWDIPDWNPHAGILRQLAHGYSVCLHHADVITVSTYPLKKAIERHHRNGLVNLQTGKEIPVVVCENKIDLRLVPPRQDREELIVGWAGSDTHEKDFEIVLPVLQQLAIEFPHVVFEFAGWIPPSMQQFSNVRFRHWTPVSEYFMRYPRWGWSIALAPLADHVFNASKSANKATESGAMGIPCLCSYEKPYKAFMKTGHPDLTWLLCAGASSWYAKLKTLILDEQRRMYLGKLMRENVEVHHSWQGGHSGWDTLFTTLDTL
jgi:glycosyltransferase involved in cell wall biosynthesis